MKKTTYILAGLLLAGLLLAGGMPFWMLMEERVGNALEFVGDEVAKPLAPFHSVYVVNRADTLPPSPQLWLEGFPVRVKASETPDGSLHYPKGLESFLSAEVQDSVLYIGFDFSKIAFDNKRYSNRCPTLGLHCEALTLCLPSGVDRFVGEMSGQDVSFSGIRCDTFSISAQGDVVLNGCSFGSLHADVAGLTLNSGSIDDLYLNIDQIYSTRIDTERFRLKTEHFSGSGSCSYTLAPGESREVLWEPLGEDASLDLKMQQPARVELR